MKKNLKLLCQTAMGIALYVVLSLTAKIPIIGHTNLDLGYIVFAVYCYYLGSIPGMIVGSAGCLLISLLTSGWVPIGWIMGNLFIGTMVGLFNKENWVPFGVRACWIFMAVFLGIGGIKTAIECVLYSIPLAVKLPKNIIIAAIDAIVMVFGTWLAPKIPSHLLQHK